MICPPKRKKEFFALRWSLPFLQVDSIVLFRFIEFRVGVTVEGSQIFNRTFEPWKPHRAGMCFAQWALCSPCVEVFFFYFSFCLASIRFESSNPTPFLLTKGWIRAIRNCIARFPVVLRVGRTRRSRWISWSTSCFCWCSELNGAKLDRYCSSR